MRAAYIYRLKDKFWIQIIGEEKLSGDRPMDRFGKSVSMSGEGNILVFGASEREMNDTPWILSS
jgi:hypothetical protein